MDGHLARPVDLEQDAVLVEVSLAPGSARNVTVALFKLTCSSVTP
jgi:hypothetical protein